MYSTTCIRCILDDIDMWNTQIENEIKAYHGLKKETWWNWTSQQLKKLNYEEGDICGWR